MMKISRNIRFLSLAFSSLPYIPMASTSLYGHFSTFSSSSIVSFASSFPSSFRLVPPSHARRFFSSEKEEDVTVKVPSMGDSITEGTLNHWKKSVGMGVKTDEVVAVVDTDKVSVDITSPHEGSLKTIFAQDGETIFVGKPLFVVTKGKSGTLDEIKEEKKQDSAAEKHTTSLNAYSPPPSPSATPDTPASSPSSPPPPTTPSPSPPPSHTSSQSPSIISKQTDCIREEKRVTMSRMRMRIAERLKSAQNTAAMLTTFNECDMSNLMSLRSEMNDSFQKAHGVKLGFVSAFMMAASLSLQKMPDVNAYIEGKEIVYKNYVDISVAVATPSGLMVPVVKNCHKKMWHHLEQDLVDLASRARKGQIALEEMAGGTFTISNGGVYGSMLGTPILNPPQSSILGMHSITKRAVVRDDQIVIRPMMYLALTYDHRMIDGREAVKFLCEIRDYIENPKRMLLMI